MGLPLYTAERLCGTGLVSDYITYIGEREPNNVAAIHNGNPESPFQASLVIGASCLLLVHGMDEQADAGLLKAQDSMSVFLEQEGRHSVRGPAATQMRLIASMLLGRDNPDTARQFQLELHAETMANLARRQPLLRRHGCSGGEVAEHTLAALLTRFAGPGTMAVPALMHHDRGIQRKDCTDMIVVDRETNSPPATVQRVQLKQYCLGFCGAESGAKVGDKIRNGYMEDVVLVSAHCDVVNSKAGHSLNGLIRRLRLEAGGKASPSQIEILDKTTLHALQSVIDPEPWRMGKAPMAKSLEFSRSS